MKDQPLDDLLAEIAREPDPRERLRRIAEARHTLGALEDRYYAARRDAIESARPVLRWREIGEIFGVSPQRAHEMSNPTPTERTNP